jgi:hypothetical protein
MKITLCGSTRFRPEYEAMNRDLSIKGHIVYSVACFGNGGDALTDTEKELLDLVHLKKIMESDAIVVVGSVDGKPYVGESTRREIRWAKMLGKGVYYAAYDNHLLDPFKGVDSLYPVHPAGT